MTTTVKIPLEPFSDEAFAPYGQAVGPLPGGPAWQRPGLTSWRMQYSCDGIADLKLIRYSHKLQPFSRLERHVNHTETRIPLMGGQFILGVAGPSPDADSAGLPDPKSLRAFFFDGSRGVLLWKNIWHTLDTFPAHASHVDVAFISEKGTQAEIEVVGADPFAAKLTDVIDYAPQGLSFSITDPKGLLAH